MRMRRSHLSVLILSYPGLKKIFDYKVSTCSIDVIDPDDKEPIVSLFQGTGYEWQMIYNSQGDDKGFSD